MKRGKFLWLWVGATIVGTAVVGAVIFVSLLSLVPTGKTGPTTGDIYDVTRSSVAATGILAAAGGAVLAYRAQQVRERQHALDERRQTGEDKDRDLDRDRDFRARYGAAAEHLGSKEAAVRLSGAFAMASLASDVTSPQLRQSCIDVLCSYLRMPPRRRKMEQFDADYDAAVKKQVPDEGDGQVRQSILTLLQEQMRRSNELGRWEAVNFDLRGARLGAVDFGSVAFTGLALFDHAVFESEASFAGAEFLGEASFVDTRFNWTTQFMGATFYSDASFRKANFTHGANFASSRFLKRARFNSMTVMGGANFRGSRFMGFTSLASATFHGATKFTKCTFGHDLRAEGATFGGIASFRSSDFYGNSDFTNSDFRAEPTFRATRWSVSMRAPGAKTPSGVLSVPAVTGDLTFRTPYDPLLDSPPRLIKLLWWTVLPPQNPDGMTGS